jgi:biopolymer transport protein ExbD
MKVPRRSQTGSVGFDMTPMIDIVFQLIIFFLLTGHLVKQETQLQLPLPVAASGEDDADDDAPRVTLNVLATGEVSLGSGAVTLDELTARLREKRAESGAALQVRIRSDRRVAYRVVQPLMRACTQAGIWHVTFAVYRPEEARAQGVRP